MPDPVDLGGAKVTVFGAFTATDADGVNEVIDQCFNGPYNANAFYEGSDSFETQIKIRIEGDNAPDVAFYPQPGAVVQQAQDGQALALEDIGVDVSALTDVYGDYLMSLGEVDGKHYGTPSSVNLKSLIWYNMPIFEQQGYEIPKTWDDLMALSDRMVSDGYTPWCIGTGSDAATGWPATDWLEDIMLRTAGADVYDQWVSHDIPFNDPAVEQAANLFGDIVFNPDYIVGTPSAIPSIDFRDAVDGLVTPSVDEPTCLLHRQASFITAFFPDGTEVGTDVGVFAFPKIDPDLPTAALMAGDYIAVFHNRPEVVAFLEAINSPGMLCAIGGHPGTSRISPNINTSADCYTKDILATSAQTILDAVREGGARFDASDLMPPEVGSGTFWSGMNEWMQGKPTDQVLSDIEASWPQN
jgi:alpha-glucoside transport system substrate-binding protein